VHKQADCDACDEDVCTNKHAQGIVEILQPPFFLASLVFWLFLASMVSGITLSPFHVCIHSGTPVLNSATAFLLGQSGILVISCFHGFWDNFVSISCLYRVKKFPVFYSTGRSITAFTSARHLSLS